MTPSAWWSITAAATTAPGRRPSSARGASILPTSAAPSRSTMCTSRRSPDGGARGREVARAVVKATAPQGFLTILRALRVRAVDRRALDPAQAGGRAAAGRRARSARRDGVDHVGAGGPREVAEQQLRDGLVGRVEVRPRGAPAVRQVPAGAVGAEHIGAAVDVEVREAEAAAPIARRGQGDVRPGAPRRVRPLARKTSARPSPLKSTTPSCDGGAPTLLRKAHDPVPFDDITTPP